MVPHIQTGYHVSRPTIELTAHALFVCTGLSPCIARLSRRFHQHMLIQALPPPRSLAATGNLVDFPQYLDVSVPAPPHCPHGFS